MLTMYPTILPVEASQAKQAGMTTLAGLAIDQAVRKLYSAPNSLCGNSTQDYALMRCLYLYMYVADSWCADGCNPIDEQAYTQVIRRIEELQQKACDFRITGTYESNIPNPVSEPLYVFSTNQFSTVFL